MTRPIHFSWLTIRWDLLFLASTLTFVLLYWCFLRCSGHTFVPDGQQWPRPFPYPDKALYALERIYDAKFPAPPRTIKIHGEFPSVQATLLFASMFPLIAGVFSLVALLVKGFRRLPTPDFSMLVVLTGAAQLIAVWYFSPIFIGRLLSQVILVFVLVPVAWLGLQRLVAWSISVKPASA
jgi:hypothetical protein